METLVVSRSVLEDVGGFDGRMHLAEDADWYARANDRGVIFAVLPQVVLLKRIHDANASSDTPTSNRELLKALRRQISRARHWICPTPSGLMLFSTSVFPGFHPGLCCRTPSGS